MSKNPIPDEALDKHIAFLGGTGSGKTSSAKRGIVEPALEVGERVLVIDPTSAWWGLRLGRDGKSKGYPVYIFGGDHGDYPLRARDAEVLAEAFATSSDSAIFDTSLMTVTERTQFFTDFAEAIRRKNRGPLKLIIDEAHLFMPQSGAKSGGAVPAMLHAGNNLVSLGRSRGLRITLISQRPAKLHKDSLTQVQTLVAMRLMAPQDRAAINDWVADQADPTKGKEIIASLPTLKPGEAWVWAPLAGVLDRVHFPMPRTFDSSRAPDMADGKGPSLAPINLDALKGRLATVEADAKANDPKALRAELAASKAELAKLRKNSNCTEMLDPKALSAARAEGYAAGWTEGDRDGFARGAAVALDQGFGAVRDALRAFVGVQFVPSKKVPSAPKVLPTAASAAPSRPQPAAAPRPASRTPAATAPIDGPTAPQSRVLQSLAFWASIGHDAPTREQVAAVAGYRPGSGNFNNIIGSLSSAGHTEVPQPGRLRLLTKIPAPTADEAQAKLWSVFENPQRRLVEAALAAADDMSREELATAAGYAPGSGNFNNICGSLTSMDVLQRTGQGRIGISDWAREVLG